MKDNSDIPEVPRQMSARPQDTSDQDNRSRLIEMEKMISSSLWAARLSSKDGKDGVIRGENI